MIPLIDTSPKKMAEKSAIMECGQLLTPLTRYSDWGGVYAIDNGAFSKFDERAFLSLLERQYEHRDRCKFVAVPDKPFQAMRTLELFEYWQPRIANWPLAFVAQNGCGSVKIPWDDIDAIFIGGDDSFKMGDEAVAIIETAKMLGKWTHVGRVNGVERFMRIQALGVDSIDGSGLAMYDHMLNKIAAACTSPLFTGDHHYADDETDTVWPTRP